MGQYTTGQARLNTTTTVELVDGGDTSDVRVGDLFRFQADTPGLTYVINTVTDATHFTLTAPYAGIHPLSEDHDYLVARDFTPTIKLAELQPGDVDIREFFTYNMRILDALFGSSSGGGGGGGGGATSAFEAGTRMVFDQDTSPVGWTRDVSPELDDRMIRTTASTRAHGGSWTVTGITIGNHQHELPIGAVDSAGGNTLAGRAATVAPFGVGGSLHSWDRAFTQTVTSLSSAALLSGVGSGPVSSSGAWRPLHRSMIVASKD